MSKNKLTRRQMEEIQDGIITVLFVVQAFLVVLVVLWMVNILNEPCI